MDAPDAGTPGEEPYNVYRYNSKRWDAATGTYDMGFRDYSPGLNRFLSRDTYTGALADLNLSTSPWNNNRYAFTNGNPTTMVELDGHRLTRCEGNCGDTYQDSTGTVEALVPYTPPITFTPPPAPVTPGALLKGSARGGAIAIIATCLLFCLSGDSASTEAEQTIEDMEDRERKCADRTGSLSQIGYLPLDDQGRAQGAYACLTMSATAIDSRAPRTPSGWEPGMDRGHLVARQFGGCQRRGKHHPVTSSGES